MSFFFDMTTVDMAVSKWLPVSKILGGDDFDYHCHSNLVRAIKPFGLVESNVHDNVNLFQVTGLTNEDQYFM